MRSAYIIYVCAIIVITLGYGFFSFASLFKHKQNPKQKNQEQLVSAFVVGICTHKTTAAVPPSYRCKPTPCYWVRDAKYNFLLDRTRVPPYIFRVAHHDSRPSSRCAFPGSPANRKLWKRVAVSTLKNKLLSYSGKLVGRVCWGEGSRGEREW